MEDAPNASEKQQVVAAVAPPPAKRSSRNAGKGTKRYSDDNGGGMDDDDDDDDDFEAPKKIDVDEVEFDEDEPVVVKPRARRKAAAKPAAASSAAPAPRASSKSLIFSQFTSTLDWLKKELPKHGFQFRTLTGDMSMAQRAKALAEFQGDPPTTIFLLSMRAGAVGINLTEANRVFLMEPTLNPALEAQAIGRVHRLGQVNPVEITRFIVKGSIEERILAMKKSKYGAKAVGDAEPGAPMAGPGPGAAAREVEVVDVRAAGAGHLHADKVEVKLEEFDNLFGVTLADLAAAGGGGPAEAVGGA